MLREGWPATAIICQALLNVDVEMGDYILNMATKNIFNRPKGQAPFDIYP